MLPVVRDRLLVADNERRHLNLGRQRQGLRNNSDAFSLPEQRFIELFRLNKRYIFYGNIQ